MRISVTDGKLPEINRRPISETGIPLMHQLSQKTFVSVGPITLFIRTKLVGGQFVYDKLRGVRGFVYCCTYSSIGQIGRQF